MSEHKEHVISIDRKFGSVKYIERIPFPIYPSVVVKVPKNRITEAEKAIAENCKCPNIFFDGQHIIIPQTMTGLIELIISEYSAKLIAKNQMKEHQFATLARDNGLNGEIVLIGDRVAQFESDANSMLEKAIKNPEKTLVEWSLLLEASKVIH